MSFGRLTIRKIQNQDEALLTLRDLATRAALTEKVRRAAIALTSDCAARDDYCELESIFNAVKTGDPRVPGLERGVRYVGDPLSADYYTRPDRLLQMCGEGACGEDCDGQAMLIASLGYAIGFNMGLRGYRAANAREFTHVYAVAATPKKGQPREVLGMDTTVPSSSLGWEPPISNERQIRTAWLR